MARGLHGVVPHFQANRIRHLRFLACLALWAVSQTLLTRLRAPAFTFGAECAPSSLRGSTTPPSRCARPARDGESGSKADGITPVVDESDFAGDPASSKPSPASAARKKKVENFDSLLKAADRYSTKAERSKRKSRSNAIALQDDLKGISLEDDVGVEIDLMSRARTGKADVSLNGRLARWARETEELVRNPTPVQVTFGVIFGASCLFVFLIFVLALSMGAIRLRGDDLQVERRRQMDMNDPFVQRYQKMMEFKKSAMEVEDLRMLNRDGSLKEEFKDKKTGKPINPSGEKFKGARSLRLFGAPPTTEELEEALARTEGESTATSVDPKQVTQP